MTSVRNRRILVTGGTGFIGASLVRALVARGAVVRCLDNNSRGMQAKLGDVVRHVETITADIRDRDAVMAATEGVETVCHLAYVNGTEFFYERPDEILEVAVKGMMNVLDACLAHRVRDLVVASSSEVYQSAAQIPTPEAVQLVVPDLFNPRYSYGGGKIISELLTVNYGRKHFDRAVIFRPHNVYGPDMGNEHVIPQFALRMRRLTETVPVGVVPFAIQGSGRETRSFIYINDFTEGLMRVIERGEHLSVYNIGTGEEISIAEVAQLVAACFGRTIEILPSQVLPGSSPRRSPDITKLRALGFASSTPLAAGIATTVEWYRECCPA